MNRFPALLCLAVCISCIGPFVPRQCTASFEVPWSNTAFLFEPQHWRFGDTFTDAESVLAVAGYNYARYRQWEETSSSPAGAYLYDFLHAGELGFGVFGIFTDGTTLGDLVFETFPRTAGGYAAAQDRLDQYVNVLQLFSYGEIGVYPSDPNSVPMYYLSINSYGLRNHSHGNNALLHLAACYGALTASAGSWNGMRVAAAYTATVAADDAKADARQFWKSLGGFGPGGAQRRTVGDAAGECSPWLEVLDKPVEALPNVVLSPSISMLTPAAESALDATTVGHVYFDVPVRISGGYVPVVETFRGNSFGTRELHLDGGGIDLSYWLVPLSPGWGVMRINSDQLVAAVPTSAVLRLNPLPGSYVYRAGTPLYLRYNSTKGQNGASAVTEFSCLDSPPGVQVQFATQWESRATEFVVIREANAGATDTLPGLTAVGGYAGSKYVLTDPGGSDGARYWLEERQEAGYPTLSYGSAEVQKESSITATELPSYDADSLGTYVAGLDDPTPEGVLDVCSELHPTYAILCPDSFVVALGPYASIWRGRGIGTEIISTSRADSCFGGFRQLIQYASEHGTRYVLLVGDANDATWWDDPTKWTNGWEWPRVTPTGPHIPSQPERNLIPTYYTPDPAAPDQSMSFYTPYYASDNPYADTDGDYLPEVAVGRLPAVSVAEINAYTAKLHTFLVSGGGATWSRAFQLTYARDNGEVVGEWVKDDADSIAAEFPGRVDLVRYDDTGTTSWTYVRRESLAVVAADAGPDLIAWVSSGAQRYIHGNYWRIDQGWSMNKLAPNPAQFFLSLGLSCDMGNFDQSEMYAGYDSLSQTFSAPIQPIVERLLLDPQRGAIACVGPSRGTFQLGNVLFAREFLRQLYSGGKTVGMAFLIAQRTMLVQHPEFADLFVSYNLLGDPVIGPYSVTAADGAPKVGQVRLDPPMPNPFNPYTVIRFALPSPGQVSLRIYDVRGRLVRALIDNRVLPAGTKRMQWDGRDEGGVPVASGVYLARLDALGRSLKQKLVLLK